MQGKVFWCTPPINYSTFGMLNRQFKKIFAKGSTTPIIIFHAITPKGQRTKIKHIGMIYTYVQNSIYFMGFSSYVSQVGRAV